MPERAIGFGLFSSLLKMLGKNGFPVRGGKSEENLVWFKLTKAGKWRVKAVTISLTLLWPGMS